MIYGVGSTPAGESVVVVGITLDELRTILADVGRTVQGLNHEVGMGVVVFSCRDDDHGRTLISDFTA